MQIGLGTILDFLKNIIWEIPVWLITFSIFILGLFIFWKGSIEKKKNVSSVFDIFIISSVLSVIYSRVTHIILNWSEFSRLIWYWIPYEKYGDQIYLFRLLPWRYFSLWDGGLDLFALCVSFMIFTTLLTLLMKRWRWKDMFLQIYFSGMTVFILTRIYFSFLVNSNIFIQTGIYILLIFILIFVVSQVLPRMNMSVKLKNRISEISAITAVLSSSFILVLHFFSTDLQFYSRINIYAFIIWIILSTIYFLTDLRRAKVSIEKLSSVRNVGSVDVNQPIKIKN